MGSLHDRMAERLFERFRAETDKIEVRTGFYKPINDCDSALLTTAYKTYIQFIRRTNSQGWERRV